MHRVVGQHGDRATAARLDRQDDQLGIDRAGGTDHVGVLVTRMHVGPHGPLSERIVEHLVGAANPAPAVGVHLVVDCTKTDARWLQVLDRPLDRLGNLAWQDLHVRFIGRAAECPHRRRCRVGVRGRNQNSIAAQPGLFLRQGFCPIDQLAGHHAGIDHDEGQPGRPVIQHEALGPNRVLDARGLALEETTVDQDRELRRRDVDGTRTCTKDSLGGRRGFRILLGPAFRRTRLNRAANQKKSNACGGDLALHGFSQGSYRARAQVNGLSGTLRAGYWMILRDHLFAKSPQRRVHPGFSNLRIFLSTDFHGHRLWE